MAEKFQSKSQIAEKYGITVQTLNTWLKKAGFYKDNPGARKNKLLSPRQIAEIYIKFDPPIDENP